MRTRDIVVSIVLACLWIFLTVAGFAAINHRADNLLALYVVVAATAITLFVRWIWQRPRSGASKRSTEAGACEYRE